MRSITYFDHPWSRQAKNVSTKWKAADKEKNKGLSRNMWKKAGPNEGESNRM